MILVRPETTPDDIHGMAAAVGILTSQGGKTSHAAVVARGMGKPAVTGAAKLQVDSEAGIASTGSVDIRRGDVITIDGTSGVVYQGEIELVPPEVPPELDDLLEWADEFRSLGVRANADTAEDATLARGRGAEGIGLARTEHMFLGERLAIVQRVILSTDPDREGGRARPTWNDSRSVTSRALLEAMDGLPVVIRLLDPPLHEFLPSRLELEHEMLRRVRAGRPIDDLQAMSDQVARWEEDNPDARPARGPARADAQGPLPDAGSSRHDRAHPADPGGGHTPPRDHDPPGRRRRGADPDAGDDRGGDHSRDSGDRAWNWPSRSGR